MSGTADLGTEGCVVWIGSDRHSLKACIDTGLAVLLVQGASGRDFGYPLPEGLRDIIAVDNQYDLETVAAALVRRGLGPGGIRIIGTNDERALVTAGALAKLFDCRGPDVATALRFRDKAVQKSIVRASGLPAADFIVIDDILSSEEWPHLKYPVVAKPVAGAGTALTRLLRDEADTASFRNELASRRPSSRTFIVEEYIEGEELHLDGVIVGSELEFLSVGTYGEPCLGAIDGARPVRTLKADPISDAALYNEASSLTREILSALGLHAGVFHLELFRGAESGDLWFGECAARRGGGLIQEEVLSKFGIDLAAAAVQLLLHEHWQAEPEVRTASVGSTYLPMAGGTLIGCPSAEEIASRPGVQYARLELPLGFTMEGAATNTVAKIGQAMLQAPSREELLLRMDELLAWFSEHLEVAPGGGTTSQLRNLSFNAGRPSDSGSFRNTGGSVERESDLGQAQ